MLVADDDGSEWSTEVSCPLHISHVGLTFATLTKGESGYYPLCNTSYEKNEKVLVSIKLTCDDGTNHVLSAPLYET